MHILLGYFNLYPLLTTKRNDYDAFCKAFIIIQEKKHLTVDGPCQKFGLEKHYK